MARCGAVPGYGVELLFFFAKFMRDNVGEGGGVGCFVGRFLMRSLAAPPPRLFTSL